MWGRREWGEKWGISSSNCRDKQIPTGGRQEVSRRGVGADGGWDVLFNRVIPS